MICILGLDGIAWALSRMSAGKEGPFGALGRFLGQQFSHVQWEGFQFYDFIFPLFVFVTGVAIVFSLTQLVEREGKAHALKRVIRRFLLLYALGIFYYGGLSNEWSNIRLLGVLQRIAICYLVASLLFMNLRLRGLSIAVVVLLLGYWALMTFVPVPGQQAGNFTPEGNLAYWIDAHFLPGRLWDKTRDPEGLLSTLPAIATCLLGVLTGMLLLNSDIDSQLKPLLLGLAGIALVAAGHAWSLQFPIIKYLWTSSFVLVAGGYSLLTLGFVYLIVDVWGWKRWANLFVWVGANAITLYLLNNLASFNQIAKRFVGGEVSIFLDRIVTPGTGSLVVALVGIALAGAAAAFLYRRNIFLRV
jgi:predicted acyltransferase